MQVPISLNPTAFNPTMTPSYGEPFALSREEQSEKISWRGRAVSSAQKVAQTCCSRVVGAVQHIFTSFAALTADCNTLATVLRRFDSHIFAAIEQFKNIPGYFSKLQRSIGQAVGVIDVVLIAADVEYFAKKKFKDDRSLTIASRISLFATNVGGATLWLGKIGFINLSRAASAMGEMRVFKALHSLKDVRIFQFLPKALAVIPGIRDISKLQIIVSKIAEIRIFNLLFSVTLGGLVARAMTLTYTLLVADSFQKLLQPGNMAQKTQAGLDMAAYVAELAVDAAVTFGMSNIFALAAIAGTSAVLAMSSLFHRTSHSKELKEPHPTHNVSSDIEAKRV